ncbi:hypothetical protein [Methylibium petroleiphilum]|uniref:hypothetical protein n=1 Tax=Methylibium petroleiphilum TaxID=105560 RepID=UPI001AC467F9|nr:hypothetical protein [Methylibium petroleiphilum]MBN9206129.1 hypothetical protein [Methylibium petroleiphilum]
MPQPRASLERFRAPLFHTGACFDSLLDEPGESNAASDETPDPIDWTEQDVVFLHWRLLQEIEALADPETPLEAKLDTLRWVFTEREKDSRPFSFVNCLRVVGCSPLSPIGYCGLVDAEEIRSRIRHGVKRWLEATLTRYPEWVREAVARNPEWVEQQLARNPQCINEQIRAVTQQGDLFA